MTSQYAKPYLQPAQYVSNTSYPDAYFQAELAELANHAALFRLKEIASFGMTTTVIASPPSEAARPRWRTQYRASPHATGIVVVGWLAQSVPFMASIDPYALIDFTENGGASVATAELHYGAASTANANPDHMVVLKTFVVSTPGTIWAPTANTLYDVTVSDVQSRIAALTIYETSLNATAPISEGYATGGPILDIDRSTITDAARLLWKRQAAHLFTWTVDDQGTPRSTGSATSKNLIDDSSTGVSAATPGFTLDLRVRNRTSATTVPCSFRAYAKCVPGTGDVKLKDSGGSTLATITIGNSGVAQWIDTTVNLPNTLAKYDIHYTSSGGITLGVPDSCKVYAVQLVQYTTGS